MSQQMIPTDVTGYLALESMTASEVAAISEACDAWRVESAGWSPYRAVSWTDENARGWPRYTIAALEDESTGEMPWTIFRSGGQLFVSHVDVEVDVAVANVSDALGHIRKATVRPLQTA